MQEDVIVIGAVNISTGSWMPILQLKRYVAFGFTVSSCLVEVSYE